jgi:hypothetical protein
MRGKGRWIALVLALVGVAWGLWRWIGEGGAEGDATRAQVERVVPESLRIRVEVLNAAGTRGLARRATSLMRDAGFDVVGSGNWPERLDSSVVLVRGGRLDWGALAAQALGGARVEARPDTSRYLDLTILLGSAWRPPPEPFDP